MKRETRFLLPGLLGILLAATSATAGDYGTVAGRVTDAETKPLQGATVRLNGTTWGAKSGSDGTFSIAGVPAGEYELRATCVGFQQYVARIQVAEHQTTTVVVNMQVKPLPESAIAVIGSGAPPSNEVAGQAGINGYSIRGGRMATVVSVDGTEPADPFNGGYGSTSNNSYPTVSLPATTSVQTQTSGFGPEFGNILSGPVNVAGGTAANTTDERSETRETAAANMPELEENAFLSPVSQQLSTFSIDADAASYGIVRSSIRSGVPVPRGLVRIEELINYFTYHYPEPAGDDPFSVTTEVSTCPWNAEHQLVSIGLQGRHIDPASLPPCNLVFLIDVSGSMSIPESLPLLKQAFALLVKQLRPQDSIAVVTYAGRTGTALEPTSGAEKERIMAAINGLGAGGGTNGSGGIVAAYDLARRMHSNGANTRVILATDGDFNIGITNNEQLLRLIEEERKDGIFLTTLGVGAGHDGDRTMEMLADNGNGTYAFLDNLSEAERVLVNQICGTLMTIAKDVKLQVEFNPATVESYRLVGYEDRMLKKEDFENDRKDAGDMGAGQSVTALYEIVPAPHARNTDAARLSDLSLRYRPARVDAEPVFGGELLDIRLRYKRPDDTTSRLLEHPVTDAIVQPASVSDNFRFASAVAEFGLLLRDSKYKGTASLDHVLAAARRAAGDDIFGYRAGFVDLVGRYAHSAGGTR
ncbi:MAG TPA: von Willebrand factor type A domain-containing protein [Candidatus Kapabacteria bacterium]|nr:von Willebrand factor type A domain-containing protein [Candidatus Kapabacteria bacterium]